MKMVWKHLIVIALMSIAASQGCSLFKKFQDAEITFAKTDVGTPTGPATTKTIGPAGSSISSPDGRITVNVPPNDVPAPIEFSIQPITNQAEGGLGSAYRLKPDGQKFVAPVDVSFKYNDQDLEGTVPEAFAIGYQDETGAWRIQQRVRLDQAAKTVTISTTHFTDFVIQSELRISPTSATLRVGETLLIKFVSCKQQGFFDKLFSRPLLCSDMRTGKDVWNLNGPGSILPASSAGYDVNKAVEYTAPPKKPNPNKAWVTLTADLTTWNPDTGEMSKIHPKFASIITIVDRGYKVSGSAGGDTVFSGVICDLEKPFKLMTTNPFLGGFDFVPSSPTAGSWSFSNKNGVTRGGGGSYTIEGTDAEKTEIVLKGSSTGCIRAAGCLSGSGDIHLALTPLTGNECGSP